MMTENMQDKLLKCLVDNELKDFIMKKWIFIIIMQICCFACFEDDSNLEIKTLNPIRIENIAPGEYYYSCYMGDTLEIKPLVFCEGVSDANLSFEWKMYGGTIAPIVLDSTMYLSAKITAPPYASGYNLVFTITDKTTGISRLETFTVTVLSPYGTGLIVADTKDGVNSDLSLIRSKEFTSDIPNSDDSRKIFKDLWSQNNGTELPGLVLDAFTSTYGTNRSLTVMTTEKLFRADQNDYVNIPSEEDENMFMVVPPNIGHGYEYGGFVEYRSTSDEFMNANGLVANRGVQNSNRKYNYILYPPGVRNYNVTLMYAPTNSYADVYLYDDLNKCMMFGSFQGLWCGQNIAGAPFDVTNLKDYEPFFLGEVASGIALLAKEKSTGNFKGLVMNKVSFGAPNSNYPKSIFDFTSATDIENAKFFELNVLEDVLYYATENKLYSTSTVNINSTVQWTAPIGEKITGIKIYDAEGGNVAYGNEQGKRTTMSSPNRLMLISTYNEGTQEGRLICIPIVTLHAGILEQDSRWHVQFTGFGKILGVYKQN